MCGSDIGSLPISDHREIRQIAVVVQEQMEFNGPFGLTEVGPGKQAQTKVNCGGIETEQFVLETEFLLFDGALAAAEVSQMKEDVLIKFPGTVGINIGQCAFGRGGTQSQMTQFTAGYGKSVANLSQTSLPGPVGRKAWPHTDPRMRNPWHDVPPCCHRPTS